VSNIDLDVHLLGMWLFMTVPMVLWMRIAVMAGDMAEKWPARCWQDHVAAAVLMATHGRTGLVRSMLGSVAGGVLHHSRSPVVLIRPPDLARCGGATSAPGGRRPGGLNGQVLQTTLPGGPRTARPRKDGRTPPPGVGDKTTPAGVAATLRPIDTSGIEAPDEPSSRWSAVGPESDRQHEAPRVMESRR